MFVTIANKNDNTITRIEGNPRQVRQIMNWLKGEQSRKAKQPTAIEIKSLPEAKGNYKEIMKEIF